MIRFQQNFGRIHSTSESKIQVTECIEKSMQKKDATVRMARYTKHSEHDFPMI